MFSFCCLADRLIFRHFPREIIANRINTAIGDFFAESNQKLVQILGVDLSEKGYQLPESGRRGAKEGDG